MQRLRRFGIIGAVAFGLSACGATPPTPTCTSPRTGSPPSKAFCLTHAEVNAGQETVHSPTIPDAVFVELDESFTIGPTDQSKVKISMSQAEATALKDATVSIPEATVRSAVLAEFHGSDGIPTDGQLVWVVDISPPLGGFTGLGNGGTEGGTPKAVPYVWVLVDARTGTVDITAWG